MILSDKNMKCSTKEAALRRFPTNFAKTRFFISKTFFISNTSLKLAKNQAKYKQHAEAKLLLFENYSLSSSVLSSKNNRRYSKKYAENKSVGFNKIMQLITMKMRLQMKMKK